MLTKRNLLAAAKCDRTGYHTNNEKKTKAKNVKKSKEMSALSKSWVPLVIKIRLGTKAIVYKYEEL